MERNQNSLKVYNPSSLLAFALKVASKCYKVSQCDPFSYVKMIDFRPLPEVLSSPDFGISCKRNLLASQRRRLYNAVDKFMWKRLKLIETVCAVMANMIVNADRVEEIEGLDMTRLRRKYIKITRLLGKMEKLDVKVNLGDPVQKLLSHIQEERARQKEIRKFVYQEWHLSDIGVKESVYQGGFGQSFYDSGAGGDSGRVFHGGKSSGISAISKSVKQKEKCAVEYYRQEVDSDDDIVLYGMISV